MFLIVQFGLFGNRPRTKRMRCHSLVSCNSRQCCQGGEISAAKLKGAVKKCEGQEILAAEFFLDLQKRAEKGPNVFKTHGSGVIWKYLEMNTFSTQLYAHILLQFFSFQHIISPRQHVFMEGRIFFLAAEFF
jgi:hypothetical protein